MKTVLIAFAASLSLFAGCSKSGGSKCEKIIAHTAELMKMEIPESGKEKALAKCEKSTEEQKDCALKATSVDELMSCR